MKSTRAIAGLAATTTLTVLALSATSRAHPSYMTAFTTKYPTSTLPARMASLTGSNCNVCHTPGNTSAQGSCYKDAIVNQLALGNNIATSLTNVALLDSDGDGVANQIEILLARTDLPGQVGYHPGLKGPTGTGPCNTNPNTAVTNQLETPPPTTCYANCDGVGGLTGNDFQCFLNAYVSGASYANCDGVGGLTGNDFQCFLDKYVAGCT